MKRPPKIIKVLDFIAWVHLNLFSRRVWRARAGLWKVTAELWKVKFLYSLEPKCPTCRTLLVEITYPSNSMFNKYQWEAAKAGDYYCPQCSKKDGGFVYWWKKDI